MLAAHCGYPSISTGAVLREAVANQTDLGRQAQKIVEGGDLVPDPLVNEIVRKRLQDEDARRGFILDGYPRTIAQAEYFESLCHEGQIAVLAIGILVDDEVLVERLSRRKTCTRCGKIFNADHGPAPGSGRCDECGGELMLRRDDRPDVVRERLQVYHQTTRPLVEFYCRRGQFVSVNGEGEPDTVFEAIRAVAGDGEQNRAATR
jgi:adenylate kinase